MMGRARFWSTISLAALFTTLWAQNQAQAHFPFRPHCHVRPICPPCPTPVFWGGGCWPTYSFYRCSPVYIAPICYPPIYYQSPIYYHRVVYFPVAYQPVVHSAPLVSHHTLRATSMQAASAQPVVQKRTVARSPVTLQRNSSPLTTYSPVWTESAIGLIDEMMERGEWELAHQSLLRMQQIATPLNHRVLVRQAVMDLVANRDAFDAVKMDRVIDLLNQAAEAGSPLSPDEFRGASLSKYLRASDIELNPVLDRLAQRVLQQPERSGREMLLLSVLLKLDGQQERSELFAKESRILAARSDAFRWASVLRSLGGPSAGDALLAAKE